MAPETKEALANRLYDQLEAPERMTGEQLRGLLKQIQGSVERPDILTIVRQRLSQLDNGKRGEIQKNLDVLSTKMQDGVTEKKLLEEVAGLRGQLDELKADFEPPPATTAEWAGREMRDIGKDFMEGGILKKAGYVTGVYLGYCVISGAWKMIRSWFAEEGKEEGKIGKAARWITSTLGAVAGAVGISQLLKMFGMSSGSNGPVVGVERGADGRPVLTGPLDRRVNNPFIPDVIEAPIEGGAEGGFRALDDLKQYFGPAYDVLMKSGKVQEVLKNREGYKTMPELIQAITLAAMADGIEFGFEGGKGVLRTGVQLINLDCQFGSMLLKLATTGEVDIGDLMSVYVEGAVLYGTSFAILKAITLGRYGKNASILLEAGLWPVYTVKRVVIPGATSGFRAVKFTYSAYNPDSALRLGLSRNFSGLTQRQLSLGAFAGSSEEGLLARHQFMLDQGDLLRRARACKGVDADTLRMFEAAEAKSIKHFQSYLKPLIAKSQVPKWFTDAHASSSAKGIALADLNDVQIREIAQAAKMEAKLSADALDAAASVPKPVITPPPSSSPGSRPSKNSPSSPRGGTGAPRPPDPNNPSRGRTAVRNRPRSTLATALSPEAKSAVAAQEKLIRVANKAAVVEALDKLGDLNPKMARLLNESDSFCNLFAAHLKTADDPLAVLARLDAAVSMLDDPMILAKVATNEASLGSALKAAAAPEDFGAAILKLATPGAAATDVAADLAKTGRLGELAATSPKIAQALEKLAIHPNFARLLNESEPFAKLLGAQLSKAEDPVKMLTSLNSAATKLEDPLIIAKIATSESRLAKVVSVVDKGGDITVAFSKTAKVLKVLNAAGMVADAFVIYTTVLEMIETKNMIDALDKRGGNAELRSLYMQRYAFHAAQIGVAGTGLVTGGLALAGVGGTVAGPVALATLPVSALLYAGYQGHQWSEAKARTAKDWSAEYDTPSLITDLRNYDTMTEGVGHLWDAGFDNWRWLCMLSPVTSAYQTVKGAVTGELMDETKQLFKDMKNVNEKKIRAVVEQTTMVTVPDQVTGEDGNPRDLTKEEVEAYKTAARKYVEAKVQFIMNRSKSDFTPISSGEDVLELMKGAENYGLLRYSQSLLTSQGQPLPKNWPSGTTSIEDASKQYGELRQRQAMEGLYSRYLLQSAMTEETGAATSADFERDVGQYLLQETQPVIIRFMVECQEENFQDWWPDGNAMQVLRAYLMEGLTPILRSESGSVVKGTLADIARDTSDKETEGYKQHPVDALQQRVRDAQAKIKEHFLGRRPKSLWAAMSDADKSKYATAVGTPPSQYYPEIKDKEALGDSVKEAVPIELLLSQKGGAVPARGEKIFVKNAKDYQFVPIREGTVPTPIDGSEIVKIESNDPFQIDLGKYQVYRPGQEIPYTYQTDTTPRLTVSRTQREADAKTWETLKAKRFAEGSKVLAAAGASQIASHKNVFVLRKSVLDLGVQFYFDQDAGKWRVNIGALVTTENIRWKSAMAGKDPSVFRVQGMAFGGSQAYNDVIEQIEKLNEVSA